MDIFLRFVSDGIAELYTFKYLKKDNIDIYNEKINSFKKSNDDIDILNWALFNCENKRYSISSNSEEYYHKAHKFFYEIDLNYGEDIIKSILKHIKNNPGIKSEELLLFLENKIGKDDLKKFLGKDYIERVLKYKQDFRKKIEKEDEMKELYF